MTDSLDLLHCVRSGPYLDGLVIPDVAWAVPGLIPEGLTLLAGAPKRGKSWLILDVALAVASGGRALGAIDVEPGRVLYLALEDSERRLQERIRHLHGGGAPDTFDYAIRLPAPGAVIPVLREYLSTHGDVRLVIIDTLGKVRPPQVPGTNSYDYDYRVAGVLKAVADEFGVALVCIHHDRKMRGEDFVDNISGTNGLAGAADTIIMLERPRGEPEGALRVTGRDVDEHAYTVRMIGGAWQMFDAPPPDRKLGDRSSAIIEFVHGKPEGVRAEDVAAHLGTSPDIARRYLARLVETERLYRPSRGLYTSVLSVPSVPSDYLLDPEQDTQDGQDTYTEGAA